MFEPAWPYVGINLSPTLLLDDLDYPASALPALSAELEVGGLATSPAFLQAFIWGGCNWFVPNTWSQLVATGY